MVFRGNAGTIINIASKDLATKEMQTSLLEAVSNGRKCMEKFITTISQGEEVVDGKEFYEKIERKCQNL